MLHALFFAALAHANPYPDSSMVPSDREYPAPPSFEAPERSPPLLGQREIGAGVLRITVKEKNEKYSVAGMAHDFSGTPALARRSKKPSGRGSYRAILRDKDGHALSYDDIGLGREFRLLVDGITFRFPYPAQDVTFELSAENPESGKMEKVLSETIHPSNAPVPPRAVSGLEIRELKRPESSEPELRVNIYAEGYLAGRKAEFWPAAQRTISAMLGEFPLAKRMHFYGVFAPSRTALGHAGNLGTPVPERNSFLGLYFPYWESFGRWFNVVYPTREARYRDAIATAPYDYAIAVADDGEYWGVGNYRELVAIPGNSSVLTYLLIHEIGHYFGLNEEYEGGGRTELEFAPGISEPWSPNITFHAESLGNVKWSSLIDRATPIPTSDFYWSANPARYGAYRGGYGDSLPRSSHKPGHDCVMERFQHYCDICRNALTSILRFDAGDATL